MRFLRMLTNAVLAGALAAAYLTILVLQLNPEVPLASRTALHWYMTLDASYGVHFAIAFYVLMLLREFFSVELFSPGWISVRLLAWMSAAAAATAAVLMWLNLVGLPFVLADSALRRFAIGAYATSAAALVLFAIAVAHYSFGRRGSRVGAALLAIGVVGSLALPLAARGAGGQRAAPPSYGEARTTRAAPAAGPRVSLILLDGASLDFVWPRAADGRLPNFGRLLDGGAWMDLATIRPTQPDPVWTTVATGMYPFKSGVRSAALYYASGARRPLDLLPDYCFSHTLVQLGIVSDERQSSAALRARPLWSVLNDYGISTGIVRWPLTDPIEPLDGFMVSDRFHQILGSMSEIEGRSVFPAAAEEVVRTAFAGADTADVFGPQTPNLPVLPTDVAGARWDRFYARAMHELQQTYDTRVTAIRYQGLDIFGHYFLRDAQPSAFGDVPDDERQRYGTLLDRYYSYIDGQVGAAIDGLQPGDLLLVVSGFGMQPVSPLKRLVAKILRQPDASGSHDRAPDGFLLAYGTAVAHGRRQRGSIADVAPTVLYYLGVPSGRDMDGFTRADLFTKSFTAERPITFIPSHQK